MSKIIDYIDLTNSFTLAEHSILANEVIILDSDESFISEVKGNDSSAKKVKPQLLIKKKKKSPNKLGSIEKVTSKKYGECPICWDEFGENPLASTKCGHVFCMNCLQKSLLVTKKCPTCRCCLRGKGAYHPLYLRQ